MMYIMASEKEEAAEATDRDFENEVYLHSVIGHKPGSYYKIFETPGTPLDTEEIVPQTPKEFKDMIKTMREAGWAA